MQNIEAIEIFYYVYKIPKTWVQVIVPNQFYFILRTSKNVDFRLCRQIVTSPNCTFSGFQSTMRGVFVTNSTRAMLALSSDFKVSLFLVEPDFSFRVIQLQHSQEISGFYLKMIYKIIFYTKFHRPGIRNQEVGIFDFSVQF